MSQYTKYYASFSEYGTTTTFGSVGRTLEVFFLEDQRDKWVEEDVPADGEQFREPVTLRQAGAILTINDFYTVHEPDGSTWVVAREDILDPDIQLPQTLLTLASKVLPLEEQDALELDKIKDTAVAEIIAEEEAERTRQDD
ncbi:MAG: hypothetical protein ACOX2M_05445 [Fastidiosipilaceae bacterium]|jgi:hypothetical protein